MNNFDVEKSLESFVVSIDTREQNTDYLKRRIEEMNCKTERMCLPYGDYSCKCTLPNGEVLDFSGKVVIERKMNLDELCLCFGKERKRFKAEFERAIGNNCRVYLLIENATWENAFFGKYRSKYNPCALIASILAWIPRYNMVPILCKAETSGKLIKEILYRELKEYLMHLEEGDNFERHNTVSSSG
jgi:ERCC4-type nuclease